MIRVFFSQDKDVRKIQDFLNKEILTLCAWFVYNKLSIHFGDDKAKCVLFYKTKSSVKLNVFYGDHDIKQYHTIEYLRCHHDSDLSGESLAMKVLKKVNEKVFFFVGKTNV